MEPGDSPYAGYDRQAGAFDLTYDSGEYNTRVEEILKSTPWPYLLTACLNAIVIVAAVKNEWPPIGGGGEYAHKLEPGGLLAASSAAYIVILVLIAWVMSRFMTIVDVQLQQPTLVNLIISFIPALMGVYAMTQYNKTVEKESDVFSPGYVGIIYLTMYFLSVTVLMVFLKFKVNLPPCKG